MSLVRAVGHATQYANAREVLCTPEDIERVHSVASPSIAARGRFGSGVEFKTGSNICRYPYCSVKPRRDKASDALKLEQ